MLIERPRAVLLRPENIKSFFERIISSCPPGLVSLIIEMVYYDPVTFLHQLMVCQCYSLIKDQYISQLAAVKDPHLKEVKRRLNQRLPGALLHDFGKYGIAKHPQESAEIVNANGKKRKDEEKTRHRARGSFGHINPFAGKGRR